MRRRWKVLVAVGAVALFAGILLLLPPRDDGLDWVKKYQLEQDWGRAIAVTGQDLYFTRFSFVRVPPGLEEEVRRRITRFDINGDGSYAGSTNDGYHLYFSRKEKAMFATREPSWIEQQWMAIKTKFGWKSGS